MSANRKTYDRYEDRPLRSGQRVYKSQKNPARQPSNPPADSPKNSSRYANQDFDKSTYGWWNHDEEEPRDSQHNAGTGTRGEPANEMPSGGGPHLADPRISGKPNAGSGLKIQPPPKHKGKGPKNYQRPDQRILEDACESLKEDDEIDASDIEVSVSKGVITLSGQVIDRTTKRQAEQAIENIRGATDIDNRLNIVGG